VRTFINREIFKKSAFDSEMELFERFASNDQAIKSYKFSDPSNRSAEVQRLTQNGLYFLNLEDLDSWNQIRIKLAQQSTFICAGFIRGGLQADELLPAFRQLSEAESKAWVGVTKRALLLGIENKNAPEMKVIAAEFSAALPALQNVTTADEYKKITAGLVGFMALDEASICEIAKTLHQSAQKLGPEERRALLRTMAPLR
jgi:hypothetical protein